LDEGHVNMRHVHVEIYYNMHVHSLCTIACVGGNASVHPGRKMLSFRLNTALVHESTGPPFPSKNESSPKSLYHGNLVWSFRLTEIRRIQYRITQIGHSKFCPFLNSHRWSYLIPFSNTDFYSSHISNL
jgi:hypothetical protein